MYVCVCVCETAQMVEPLLPSRPSVEDLAVLWNSLKFFWAAAGTLFDPDDFLAEFHTCGAVQFELIAEIQPRYLF